MTVTFESLAPNTLPFVAADLPLDPQHERAGSPNCVFAYFAARPASLSRARTIPIVIDQIPSTRTGVDILGFLRHASGGRVRRRATIAVAGAELPAA